MTSPAPNSILSSIVTTDNLHSIKQQVAASSLTALQKAAFLEMVRQHAAQPAALDGKTVGEMIVEEHAYVMALRLTAASRSADRFRRLQMSALLSASAAVAASTGTTFSIALTLRNKTARTIKAMDFGIEVRSAAGLRLGTAEFEVNHAVAPRAQAQVTVVLPYAKFGGDATAVRNARGQHLSVAVDIKEFSYSGGGAAGSGD